MEEIAKLVKSGLYINTSDFVRDAIRRRLQELRSISLDPPQVVQQRVYEFFKSKGGSAWPDEAAIELGYSVLEVLGALEQLRKRGKAMEAIQEISARRGGK
jgi:Arc/MetJ-type ribon-helix-helix transcriptional regulator